MTRILTILLLLCAFGLNAQTNSSLEFPSMPPMPSPSQQTNVPEAVLKLQAQNRANPPKPHTNGLSLAWSLTPPKCAVLVVLKTTDLTNYQIAAILPNTATNWIPPHATNTVFYTVGAFEAVRN